jgi:hypothetical protein
MQRPMNNPSRPITRLGQRHELAIGSQGDIAGLCAEDVDWATG